MGRHRRRIQGGQALAVAAAVALGVWIAVAGAARADTDTADDTFAGLVSRCRLIVLADVEHLGDGALVLDVTESFKGIVGAELRYTDEPQAAVQPEWTRAIVAFSDPSTLDFRAPTVAWHVVDDGTVDPEGWQQYAGVPPTLADWEATFGVGPGGAVASAAAPSPVAGTAGDSAERDPAQVAVLAAALVIGVGLAVLGGVAAVLGRADRRRRAA
jgi:hypothetical protein